MIQELRIRTLIIKTLKTKDLLKIVKEKIALLIASKKP